MTSVAVVIVVAVVAGVLLWTRVAVRRLKTLRARRAESLKLLLGELDERYDLVPALVAASAGAGVERSRLGTVVGARTLAIAMRDRRLSLTERAGAENTLSAALHELLVDVETSNHWPFIRVARELDQREERIAGAVRVHNDLGHTLNSAVGRFPTALFARLGGVHRVELFEVTAPPADTDPAAGSEAETVAETADVPESATVAA